jgi:hypothetical protein
MTPRDFSTRAAFQSRNVRHDFELRTHVYIVVHCTCTYSGANPHERRHIGAHGARSGNATLGGRRGRLFQDLTHGQLGLGGWRRSGGNASRFTHGVYVVQFWFLLLLWIVLLLFQKDAFDAREVLRVAHDIRHSNLIA